MAMESSFNFSSIVPEESQQILTAVGHPATMTLAIISLFLNSLVIVVILHQQPSSSFSSASPQSSLQRTQQWPLRDPQQQPQQQRRQNTKAKAHIQLFCLAASDLSLGLVVVGAGLWLRTFDGEDNNNHDNNDAVTSSSTFSSTQLTITMAKEKPERSSNGSFTFFDGAKLKDLKR